MWMRDIAQTLAKVFKQQGYNVPTTNCPNPMLYIAGLFDKGVKMIIPQCGKIHKFDNSRMKNVLGIEPRDAKDTLIDMAYSLIEAGYIKRSKKYKGPHAAAEEAQEQEKKEAEKKEGEESEEKPKENGDVKEGEGDDLKKETEGETDDKAEIKKEEEEKKSEEKKDEKSEDKSEDKKDEKTEETPAEK
ncbi:hypothetical protein CHS0354_034455 [Potamilus streckersoni]|uniref:Uncharacterized protein n=1 Tax=Potamilus streckersoni TaxID=2493646 RepID=A0AAE0RLR9_9BIVA|nr:hypothetical protein CHS0354_034455 [Potamilus streckersoni]